MMNTYLPKHTIQKPSKGWKYELDKLSDKELTDGFKNFKIKKKKGIREKLSEMRRRRNLKEKEKYGSEEDEEEQEKSRKLIADSEEFWEKYNKQRKHNPFFDSENEDGDVYMSFGKKQKKDIKGMIKKILLYGGLPTLLVVSLGVLSNKKINTGKVKKNIKVKANVQEKIFKKDFVSKLKEYYKTKRGEIKKMGKKEQKNLANTQQRKENRNKKSTNSQRGVKSPPKKPDTIQEIVVKGLLAQNLQNKTIPKKPVKKTKSVKKKNQGKGKKRNFTIGPMGQV